jgi:hypothetical protein
VQRRDATAHRLGDIDPVADVGAGEHVEVKAGTGRVTKSGHNPV